MERDCPDEPGTTTLNVAEARAGLLKAATPQAERHLLDGIARVLRVAGQGWVLLAIHLSRILPHGPRAHHCRVAAALLEDTAGRNNGQLFSLCNGDMALLFRPDDGGMAAAGMVVRLFQADVPNPDTLRTVWPLPDAALNALAYVQARAAEGSRAQPGPEPLSSAASIAAMNPMLQSAPIGDLMHRQTGVLLRPGSADRITPVFREVMISTAALETRLAAQGQAQAGQAQAGQAQAGQAQAGQAQSDPFLFGHLAAKLDVRMLSALSVDIPGAGPLSGHLGAAALHVNITLAGILSQSFATFATACGPAIAGGLRIGIELPFIEVFADSKGFVLARERVRLAGMQLVLDGLTHHALLLTSPAVLQSDLVKLNCSPALLETGDALRAALDRLDPGIVVLQRVESETALVWAMKLGIMRFQGHFIDKLLAAERLRGCRSAAGCTVTQCNDRAKAAGVVGRSGCLNTRLLDAAVPPHAPSRPEHAATRPAMVG